MALPEKTVILGQAEAFQCTWKGIWLNQQKACQLDSAQKQIQEANLSMWAGQAGTAILPWRDWGDNKHPLALQTLLRY